MHSMFEYARWVMRNDLLSKNIKNENDLSFESVIEVKDYIEKYLKFEHKGSLIIQSVIGQEFGWIVRIDPYWAKNNLKRIFNKDDEILWRAAWNGYIKFSPPYFEVFEILKEEYKRAISIIPNYLQTSSEDSPFIDKLVKHIMYFYWHGKIVLEDNLFINFWEIANDKIRKNAISFIGLSLWHLKEKASRNIIQRLKKLWVWRAKKIQERIQGDEDYQYSLETGSFGWWFCSKQFFNDEDSEWVFNSLLNAIKASDKIDDIREVVEVLAEVANENEGIVLKCLDEILRNSRDIVTLLIVQDNVYKILDSTLKSENEGIQKEAKNLINYLRTEGFDEKFKTLLK